MTSFSPQKVFTPVEVARILRVTPETIRRKIISGELGTIAVGGGKRKQYRVTLNHLSKWRGPERLAQLFRAEAGLQVVGEAPAQEDDQYDEGLPQTIRAVRQAQEAPADEAYPLHRRRKRLLVSSASREATASGHPVPTEQYQWLPPRKGHTIGEHLRRVPSA